MCDRWCLAAGRWPAWCWSTQPDSEPTRASGSGSSEASTSCRENKKTGRRVAGPLGESWLFLHLEKAERCTLRVAEDREPAARKVLRLEHRLGARLRRLVVRSVDVGPREVRPPVAGHLRPDHGGHLPAA